MMRRLIHAAGMIMMALVAGWLLAGCGGISADTAARVGDTDISRDDVTRRTSLIRVLTSTQNTGELDEYFAGLAENAQGDTIPEDVIKKVTAQQLVNEEIDRLEAVKRGISVTEEEVATMEEEVIGGDFLGDEQKMEEDLAAAALTRDDLRDQLIAALLHQKIVDALEAEITVSEEEVRAQYESRKNSYIYPEERQIRQVVLADVAAAQSVADRITAGENMSVIAPQLSIDTQSASKGGRLDLTLKSELPKAVGDAAFSLPLQQVSEPIQSDLGWYVIRVEVINPASNLTLEEVREDLVEGMRGLKLSQRLRDHEAEMKEKYDIEYAEGYAPENTGVVQ